MINNHSVIAIIPARKGSKGLPGKNIRELCGKPLIAWTIETAKKSKYIDVVLVTTDCKDIAKTAKKFGACVPFIRPDELATDNASSFDVVSHVLDFYNKNDNRQFYYSVLLEPTSPLREDDDIDRMLEMLERCNMDFDSIISIGEVNEHPSIIKRIDGKRITPFCSNLHQKTRRQDNEPAYYPYGVAYINKTETLLKEKTFYTKNTTYFKIKRYQNYEIDDLFDFLCVESVMKNKCKLK